MSYSVQVERLNPDGKPLGSSHVHIAPTEGEAMLILRRAVELSRALPQPMQFSVYGPGNRLLLSYISGSSDGAEVGAFAP